MIINTIQDIKLSYKNLSILKVYEISFATFPYKKLPIPPLFLNETLKVSSKQNNRVSH